MNRRFFLGTLSAAIATPVLPAMSAPIAQRHMATATIIARSHNRCTADMLMRHLRVPLDMANQIQTQLLRQGVITPPVAGVSLAANPSNTHCIPNEAMQPNNLLQKAMQLKEKIDDFTREEDPELADPQRREPHIDPSVPLDR